MRREKVDAALAAIEVWPQRREKRDSNGLVRGRAVWYPHWLQQVPEAIDDAVGEVMEGKTKSKVVKIRPTLAFWAVQSYLIRRTLLYHIKNFRTQQRVGLRRLKLPVLVKAFGKHIIWDGNHRTTAAILLGESLWVHLVDLDAQMNRRRPSRSSRENARRRVR